MNEEFKHKLRGLCIAYDAKNGAYPESCYQGLAIYEFFIKNGIVNPPGFKHEFIENEYKRFENEG